MMNFITTHKARIRLITILILLIALLIVGVLRYGWDWTGFSTKTLWDFMELLIVPTVLAIGGLWFNREQRKSEQRIAREREEERLLQNYFDIMTELLLEKGLRKSDEEFEVRSIARVKTYTIFRTVNKRRRTNVMWFLIQAKLIGTLENNNSLSYPGDDRLRSDIVNLKGSPLNGIDMPWANLRRAKLPFVHLRDANLQYANLRETVLFSADLCGANLEGAKLEAADLRKAKYNSATVWPDNFDPVEAGAVRVDE